MTLLELGRKILRRAAYESEEIAKRLIGGRSRPVDSGQPVTIAIAPVVTDEAELDDIVAKVRFFFSGFGIRQVTIPVSRSLARRWRESGTTTPDYAVAATKVPPLDLSVTAPVSGAMMPQYADADRILVWDRKWTRKSIAGRLLREKCLDIDRHAGQWDGWDWATLPARIRPRAAVEHQVATAQQRFTSFIDSLPTHRRAYVFGTGPSLELAHGRDFSDGYRVVCNTIVRNERLVEHIRPHFIVAGDAIYHFGNTRHAAAFRADLHRVLSRYDMRFMIPDTFYPLFARDYPDIIDKVIPIDTSGQGIFIDLKKRLAWSSLENVLNGFLLPLGSSLADEICLLGFDGRAPDAEQFWTNSSANSYPELKPTIEAAHPGFFAHMNYEDYAAAQSDGAERIMEAGERLGKRYVPLHATHIPALRRRLQP